MSAHLALVACLNEARSVHTVTFKRAIDLIQQYARHHGTPALPIVCYDDAADAATAARVAAQIVACAPYAVVGHFSSSAAAAAAPIYARAGVPLLLPAATARELTRHASTYRVCQHDDAYVTALHAFCATQQVRIERVEHDGSVHGRSIARAFESLSAAADAAWAAGLLFSGTCQNAIDFLAGHDAKAGPVVLTDDALCPDVVAPAQAHGGAVYIVGLAPAPTGSVAHWLDQAYRRQFGAPAGSYFWETIAAIQIASASAGNGLGAQTWQTVLGPLRFDAQRESGLSSIGAYRVESHGLRELAL